MVEEEETAVTVFTSKFAWIAFVEREKETRLGESERTSERNG